MEQYSLRDAQDHLPELIAEALHGKTVLIIDADEKAVRLVPVTPIPKPRRAGSARGQVKMRPDFDAPLPDFSEYMD